YIPGTSLTVTVDLGGIAAGTEATLYFDLLGFGPATSSITVAAVPHAPVAAPDAKTLAEDDGPTTIAVLANDYDVDNQPISNGGLTVTAVGSASHGTTAFTSGGVSYTPNADYYGPDSFGYTIGDPTGLTSTAVVNITVTNVPDAP